GMRVLEQPGAIGLLLRSEEGDRFVGARVRRLPGGSEIVERAQHVVAPARRKRELEPGRVDDLAGTLAAEQPSFEEVGLAAAPGGDRWRGRAAGALVRQQSLQDVDRRGERRASGSVFRLAVPPAVLELFADEPIDDRRDVLIEVAAQSDGPAVDARLDLAAEERLPRVLPPAAVPDLRDRAAHAIVAGIDAEGAQQLERRQRRGPGLSLAPVATPAFSREARASRPLAVCSLPREQSRAPALGGHARALGGDSFRRRTQQIPQYLPADCGIRFEEPVRNAHHLTITARARRGRGLLHLDG